MKDPMFEINSAYDDEERRRHEATEAVRGLTLFFRYLGVASFLVGGVVLLAAKIHALLK